MESYLFEKDFAKDYWRWINIWERLTEHKKVDPTTNDIDILQQDIILSKDASLAFFLSSVLKYKKHLMQQVIIDAKSHKYAYLFAANIAGADVKALQNIVINSKNIKYICWFGCFVKGADKAKIDKLIIKANNPKWACMWLQYYKDCDVDKLKSIIIKSKRPKPQFLFELAQHLHDPKDIKKIESLIIKAGSCKYIRLFAQNINGANIKRLERAILAIGNMSEIKKFSKIKGSMIGKFGLLI